MYPEFEKIQNLFNRVDELENTEKEFKDIFNFIFSFRKNNVGVYYTNQIGKIYKKKYHAIEEDIYLIAPMIKQLINGNKDDIVILKYANSLNWIEYFFATLMAGYRVLLLDAKTTKENTQNIINQTHAVGIISDDPFTYKEVNKVSECNLSNLKKNTEFVPDWANEVIFCSSGTTGDAKLVVFNGKNMVAQMATCKNMPQETKTIMYTKDMGEVNILAMIPFHHIFGFVAVLLWYFSWGSALVFPYSIAPNDIFFICRKVGVTHVYSVPLFWDSIVTGIERKLSNSPDVEQKLFNNLIDVNLGKADKKEFKHIDIVEKVIKKTLLGTKVKHCISGGGFISGKTLRIINGIGYPLYNGYGMTEVGVTSVELSEDVNERIKGSIGRPLYSVDYKVANNGELLIKSEAVHCKEIVAGIEQKASLDKDGYFHTGDVVNVDNDGRYYIKGRIKDVIIKSDGENIFPDELELYFRDIKNIKNYSILGVNDKNNNQKIVIVLEVESGLKASAVKQLIKEILAVNLPKGAKIDEVYFSRNNLPLANNMKVKRYKIKEAIESNSGDYLIYEETTRKKVEVSFDEKTMNEIVNPIRSIFSKVLVLPEFTIHNSDHWLYDLGGNSMNYVEVCQLINQQFEIEIPAEDYGKLTCINEFVLEVQKLKNKQ